MSGESRLTVFSEISDGVQTVYPIRFELGYLNRADVYVYQGEHGDYANQIAYSWVDSSNIELSFPLPAGESFWIRRVVNRSDLNYYFQSASINPRALDRLHLQLLMLQQELMDGFGDKDGLGNIKNTLDMRGYGIKNMLEGVQPNDAVNKAQLDVEKARLDNITVLLASMGLPLPIGGVAHNSLGERDEQDAHPASAISISGGDNVQERLENSTTCFNRKEMVQEELDQNFVIVNEQDYNVLKDLSLVPNRTGGTTQGGHTITERNCSYTLIENVDVPDLKGVGFGVLSYRTDGEFNKGNAYKNLRFIRQSGTYIPLNTQGGLLLARNKNNTVNGLYGENLGQFGTIEFKDDSNNNVVSDVVGYHCESVVYFGQENGGLTSNNVISGVVGDNSHYSVVDYNIAQYNVVMGVMCNNDEEQASQPHGITHGTSCKYNYTDGVMLKAYNLEAGVKVPYPIRFREGAEFNYVGCVQHSDSTFLRVSDPTSKANVVEMKCSKSINNLLQDGARPLGLKPAAARHDGTTNSDVTYSAALQQWIGSQSGHRLHMVSYVELDGLLFSSDRFRDVAQGDASHAVVGTGRVGTKYVAGAGTAAKRYSNTGLRTNGLGIDIGLGYSEVNVSTNPKFLTFGENNLIPSVDAELSFGSAARRGDTAFFSTGSINTSDAREKTEPMPIDEKVLDAVDRIEVTTWRWLQRIKEKGENARWHFGPVAQQVKEAFEAEGLNGLDYGVLCYDKWDDEYIDVVNAEGKPTGERLFLTKAGDRWGVRYDQLLFLLNSALRRKIQEMEERLQKLELSVTTITK